MSYQIAKGAQYVLYIYQGLSKRYPLCLLASCPVARVLVFLGLRGCCSVAPVSSFVIFSERSCWFD